MWLMAQPTAMSHTSPGTKAKFPHIDQGGPQAHRHHKPQVLSRRQAHPSTRKTATPRNHNTQRQQ